MKHTNNSFGLTKSCAWRFIACNAAECVDDCSLDDDKSQLFDELKPVDVVDAPAGDDGDEITVGFFRIVTGTVA